MVLDKSTSAMNEAWRKLSVVSILIGAHWPEVRLAWRDKFLRAVSHESALSTERLRPPANIDFIIHRFDEFMCVVARL